MVERTVRVNLVASTTAYNAAMARSAAATHGMSRQLGRMGDMMPPTRSMLGGLSGALIGTAGLKVGFDATIGSAIEWESAFAGVKKTVEGTPEQLQEISSGLLRMSKELPTSTTELAAIAESAGQLGIQTDNVVEFTRVIADLGETTNLVGQEGATQLARFANITQMSQADFDRLGSTVVDLGNNFATTEAEIVEMGLRLAGAGAQIGLTEADVMGLATTLSSLGVNAQAGGTAFSRVMIDIANAASSGGDELKAFADVAEMAPDAFARLVQESPDQAIIALVEGLGAASDRGENLFAIMEDIGVTEVRMRDALLRSAGAGDLLAEAIDTSSQAWEENNALTEEAAQRYDTTSAQVDILKNNLMGLARFGGGGLKNMFDDAVDSANALFELGRGELPSRMVDEWNEFLDLFGGGSDVDVGPDFALPDHLTGELDDYTASVSNAGDASEDAADSVGILSGEQRGAATSTDDHRKAAERLTNHLRGQSDPVFRMVNAVAELDRVQGDSEASAEDLAAAALEVVDAAGALGNDFDGKLTPAMRRNLEQAGLTAAEIAKIEGAFVEAKEAGEEFASTDYSANATMNFRTTGFAQTMQRLEEAGMTGNFRGLEGSTGDGGSSSSSGDLGVTAPRVKHAGGYAGSGPMRLSGMSAGEYPTILEHGEVVVDRRAAQDAGGYAGVRTALAGMGTGRGTSRSVGARQPAVIHLNLDGREVARSEGFIDEYGRYRQSAELNTAGMA